MRDIERELAELRAVDPSERLDSAIGDMIAGAATADAGRYSRRVPVPLVVALCGASLVAGFLLHTALEAVARRPQPEPALILELPMTPALEQVLWEEPRPNRQYFERYFSTITTEYVAEDAVPASVPTG